MRPIMEEFTELSSVAAAAELNKRKIPSASGWQRARRSGLLDVDHVALGGPCLFAITGAVRGGSIHENAPAGAEVVAYIRVPTQWTSPPAAT
jgi:hypothetical protein